MAGKTLIRGKVTKISTDPAQYKPYSPELEFNDLFVEFEVPSEAVKNETEGFILQPNELATYILAPLADSIDNMHTIRLKAQAKKAIAKQGGK